MDIEMPVIENKKARVYLSISLDDLSLEEAQNIVEEVVRIRRTRIGMNVYYDKAIRASEDE